MPIFTGNSGKVVVGSNQVVNVTNWSLTVEADEIDASCMGTQWGSYYTGIKRWSGTIEAHWDLTDTNGQRALFNALLASAFVTLYLYVDSTRCFSGSASLTSCDISVPFDGIESITFDYRGSGTLTLSV